MKRNQKAWLLTWEWIGDHAAVEDRTAGILRPRLSKEVGGEIVETIYAVHEGYVGELACWSKRFLRAGVLEDGELFASDEGTPQGGVISPLLANIYLHYALDLWFEKVFRKSCTGFTRLIRYADDYVACFQYGKDAERFHEEQGKRLGKFNLEVEPTKTKVIEFGRFAIGNAVAKGKKPATFDFLGFTHYCGIRRDGTGFRVKRVTASKKFTAKLAAFKDWLKEARSMKTAELWDVAKAKLRGHYAYYGVTDNSQGIARFKHEVKKLLFKWLNRRGKRGCLSWQKFIEMQKLFPLPEPRIKVSMFATR